MADVFISYKREDIDWAERIEQALRAEGFTVFYDLGEDGIRAGEPWDRRLEEELRAAKCCVVLWSPASINSDNVRSEARKAKNRDILVPAKIIKSCDVPLGLDVLQEADLRQWDGDRLDAQWRFLIDRGVALKVNRPGHQPVVPLSASSGEPEVGSTPPAGFPQELILLWNKAQAGSAVAQANLGFWYKNGAGGVAKDEAEAVRLYKLSANQGNANGQANLGWMYELGLGGLTKNETEAVRLYKLSANQGNADGQANLGWMYANGRGGLVKNETEAVRLFKLASDQGNASATAELQHLGLLPAGWQSSN